MGTEIIVAETSERLIKERTFMSSLSLPNYTDHPFLARHNLTQRPWHMSTPSAIDFNLNQLTKHLSCPSPRDPPNTSPCSLSDKHHTPFLL